MPDPRGTPSFRLERPDGCALRVPARGLMLGRSADCDVVLVHPGASQCHALVLPAGEALRIVALGRNPTNLNGQPLRGASPAVEGDLIELPGATFRVRSVGAGGRDERVLAWVILGAEERYAVRGPVFAIGGEAAADLRIPGWPEAALRFTVVQRGLVLEIGQPGWLGGELLEAGAVLAPTDRDRLRFGSTEIELAMAPDERWDETVVSTGDGASSIRFSFLPNGGRLEVAFRDAAEPFVAELPELRARLFAALLTPRGGFSPGDEMPDEVVMEAVWPRGRDRDRTDLNQLVHRARRDLLRAGVNPERLLYRPRRGGAVRILLAAQATIRVD